MADKYISAEALTLSLRDDPNLNAASFARVKRHIEAAPDMVKRGRWIERYHKNPLGDYIRLHCSECGEDKPNAFHANYCPNCGADMRGVEDG
jgi:Zn finger protein HypA/HybF involved in hydrogenase expression